MVVNTSENQIEVSKDTVGGYGLLFDHVGISKFGGIILVKESDAR